jgi:hypothetical protein
MEEVFMKSQTTLESATVTGCDCCLTGADEPDGGGEPYGCHERKTVFTYREERVLKKILEARERAKALKERILALADGGSKGSPEKERALQELEDLRALRQELEAERVAAAEERMRLLGHI